MKLLFNVSMGLLGAAFAVSASAASNEVVIATNGGSLGEAINEAIIKPFAEKNNIKVTLDTQDSTLGPVKAQVESKKIKWDVVYLAPIDSAVAADEGLLTPIDYDVVETQGLREGSYDEYRVGAIYSATVVGWNSNLLKDVEGPEAVFDLDKYPGKRAIRTSTPYGVLEIALMADGVAMDELYPLDVDRAFKKLDTIKDETIFYSTNEQGVQLLASGEASIGLLPNGRAYNAKNNGQPLDITFNGGVMFIDYWVVPKGAPNSENAMKFIDAVSDAEGQRKIGKIMAYGGNNPEADAGYDDAQRSEMPTSADNEKLILKLDGKWWSENLNDVFKRWQTWLLR